MSTLVSLSSSYYYGAYTILTSDVADFIPSIRSELLTKNSPAWTEPSTALFKSPVDAAGRFFDILFTRIDALTLEFRVRDQAAKSICTRRIQIGSGTNSMLVASGQFHFNADFISPGGNASLFAGILDLSPDAQTAHQLYVYGSGYLSNTNTNDGYGSSDRFFMLDSGSSSGSWNDRLAHYSNSSNGNSCLYSLNGARIYKPVETYVKVDSTNFRVAGRRYQQLMCTSDLTFMNRISVPIDNVSGVFQVTAIPSQWGTKILVRVG